MRDVSRGAAEQPAGGKSRKDAARNRKALIAAARQEFDENGIEGSLKAVARRAGVGAATLYRHVPTRDSLIECVYAEQTAAALERLRHAASQAADPQVAAAVWLDFFSRTLAQENGLRRAFTQVQGHHALGNVLQGLLDQALAARKFSPPVRPEDLLCVAASLTLSPSPTDPQRGRVMAALLAGDERPSAYAPALEECAHDCR